ncbi:MAG: hypothetical protein AAGK00_17155 [Pseudomonadota bacterium]
MTIKTNTPATLADDALDQAQGGAAYVKFDGINGESRATRGAKDVKVGVPVRRMHGSSGEDTFVLGSND